MCAALLTSSSNRARLGDTSRKGNLCTLRRGGGVSRASQRSEATLGYPFIGVPGVVAREYQVNEDIPLHLAVENFNAAGSVHAWDPLWDPCSAISIRVLDIHGKDLPDNSRQGMNLCSGHGFGPNKEFSQGKLYPIERSLTMKVGYRKSPVPTRSWLHGRL
jgi:hypothetical protein